VGLYMLTTVVAAVEGLTITFILKPLWSSGGAASANLTINEAATDPVSDAFANLLRESFPDNLFGIFTGVAEGPNLLGMIVFAGLFGAGLTVLQGEGKTDHISPIIENLLDVTTVLVMSVARFTPPAVGAMVLSAVAREPLGDLVSGIGSLAIVASGCSLMMVFHVLVFQSCLYYYIVGKSPLAHMRGLLPATAIALGTGSSAVTLPTTIACCERLGYEPSIVRFVLSLGATISMDGTALYYGPLMLYLADTVGVSVSFGQVIVTAVVATLSSMGAAPVPGAGIAMYGLIFATIFPDVDPLPPAIAYAAAIDWIMDRTQAGCNINGDSFVTAMIDHIAKQSAAGGAIAHALEVQQQEDEGHSALTLRSLGNSPFDLALKEPPLLTPYAASHRSSGQPSPHAQRSGHHEGVVLSALPTSGANEYSAPLVNGGTSSSS